ncbi:integrase [Streptomyces sp. NBC_01320]|uniref:integrase n=1 Tax=Streptomyces sp. NBC_01320 TaxID=2903824 RepID=UPI002E130B91|nr:integrase [Streptomyces sp. NBC_01320]
MDLEDAGWQARFPMRDRNGRFPDLFDAVLNDAGVGVVLGDIEMPRMNSIWERWVQICRCGLLDRILIWIQCHLLQAIREFEQFHDSHQLHQGIGNARPLHSSPAPTTDPGQIACPEIRRRERLGSILT